MVDYFLKIDSVPGDSHDAHHLDEIPVVAFAWGESNTAAPEGGGGAVGKVQPYAFRFTAVTSKASPKLMVLCANGKHVATAVLVARSAGRAQQEHLKITFTDVTIAAYQIAASGDGGPVDDVSLSFAKIQIDYRPQNANGSLGTVVHGGWDLLQNKEF